METRKLKDKATEAFTKGRFSKAAELYEEYCRAEPKDHQSRLRTGDAWVKAGQKDRAISAYQSAAEGFAKEGFLPRAIAASKLILELDPAHRGVQQMLADLYARRSTAPAGMGRGGGGLSTPAPIVSEPVAKSRLPDEVRAAVAAIELDDDPPAPAGPQALEASGAKVDLSSELPAELTISVDPPGGPGSEEVVHSVSVGLSPAGDDEPVLVGVAVEEPAADDWEMAVVEGAPDEEPAPAAPVPPAPPMAASTEAPFRASSAVSAPRPEEGARPAASSLPPGLAPRISQRVPAYQPSAAPPAVSAPAVSAPPATPAPAAPLAAASAPTASPIPPAPAAKGPISGKWRALSSPIGAPAEEGSVPPSPVARDSAPPGLRPRRAEPQPPAGATALPYRELSPEFGNSLRAAAGPSSFTELELEADSLLHAVELAAQSGQGARTAMATAPGAEDEEEVFSLTEEVLPDTPSLDALPTIPLFSDLPRDAFIELFERCPLRRFSLGERIIEQGSHGDSFYVICEGSVRVFRTDGGQRQDLATLEGGAVFGEMALLSGAPRTASVEGAAEDTQLLEISASVLAGLSRSYPLVAQALKKFCRQRMLTNVMNTSALFRPFNRKDRRTLVERFRARDVERDDIIIRDGGETDGLYVVLSGEVEVRKDGHLLTRLKEGDLFGEISLLQKTPATATVTATRHTTLLRLPRKDFDQLISSHPQILVLISELSDERLRRTQRVLGAAAVSSTLPADAVEEELILV